MTGLDTSRPWRGSALCVIAALVFVVLGGCKHSAGQNSNVKKYEMKGTVVSVNADAKTASIDTEEIPGFMMPMTMDYDVHDAADLAKLKPREKITADLVVDQSSDNNSSYIENVKVVGQATEPAVK
jgi:Cu/Ag efflux protein CusF